MDAARRRPKMKALFISQVLLSSVHYYDLKPVRGPGAVWLGLDASSLDRSKHTSQAPRNVPKEGRMLNGRLCQAKGRDELLRLVEEEGHRFGFVNMATCINRLSRLLRSEHEAVRNSAPFQRLVFNMQSRMMARANDIGPQGLGNIINGLAKLEHDPGVKFVDAFVDTCMVLHLEGFKPQELANIIHGLAKLGHMPSEEFLRLFVDRCIELKLQGFNPQDMANIMNGFARLGYHPGEAFLKLFVDECIAHRLEGFKPQELANVINGLAKLGHQPEREFLELCTQTCIKQRLRGFNMQDLAHIINGFVKLRHQPEKEFLELFIRTCVKLRFIGFDPQALANIINGLAKLGYQPGKEFLELFIQTCMKLRLRGFTPQELANIINGLAKLGHQPKKEFLELFIRTCMKLRLNGFTPQDLASIINGLAKLGYRPEKEFLELFTQTCIKLSFNGFTTQELAICINGLAKLGFQPGGKFMVCFIAACEAAGLINFTPQGLANTVDGLGKCGYYPRERWMGKFIVACMHKGLHSFEPAELTGLMGGLAALRYKPPADFIDSFIKACMYELEGCDHQVLGTILTSFASLGLTMANEPWDRMMSAFAKLPSPSVVSMNSVIWAASVTSRHGDLAKVASLQALTQASSSALAPGGALTSLCQASKQALYSLDSYEAPAARQLLQSIVTHIPLEYQVQQEVRPSELHRSVARDLREGLGLHLREEQVIADGAITLDIMVIPREGTQRAPVGIEVDGPSHYLSNHHEEPTGTTQFKRRLLDLAVQRGELEAWVLVPYWAWDRLEGRSEQQRYLHRLLEAKGLNLAEYVA